MNDVRLPEVLTIDSLNKNHNSVPRNFLIADTFYKSGQIENWGRGVNVPHNAFSYENIVYTLRQNLKT